MAASSPSDLIAWFHEIGRTDGPLVGGKNASLGELSSKLRQAGVRVPPGFALTSNAYWRFVDKNDLRVPIKEELARYGRREIDLQAAGDRIRRLFLDGNWPDEVCRAVRDAYRELGTMSAHHIPSVAVRSSATAEDLPEASFAGQLETFLNVSGEDALLDACRKCFASLFTDRAISYRDTKGFDHMHVGLSVGVQCMVRADHGASGVMFSIDTETGFDRIVLINAAWGLGETVVQGVVDPDEYHVFKPLLADLSCKPILKRKLGEKTVKMVYGEGSGAPTIIVETSPEEQRTIVLDDDEILQLARWAVSIENHYGCAMDMEWAKDGVTGDIYVVQARPETVRAMTKAGVIRNYSLKNKGDILVRGLSVGDRAAAGVVQVVESPDQIGSFIDGAVLVTSTTDPDWVPIMKRAAAIVTDHGGRTSHAAIISRELGLPAVVGAENATAKLKSGDEVTVSCAEGDEGRVYAGQAEIQFEELDIVDLPDTRTQVMLNMADPSAAYRWWQLPADGVGLARMEFVISNYVRVHPMALLDPDKLTDADARQVISHLTSGYSDGRDYFVDRLSRGLAEIAAVQYPHPVIIRMSDFKTNEYASLIGGRQFEPDEENPMIGFRGAARYYSVLYRDGFALECQAICKLREEIGLSNVVVMIPFCRTLTEADRVLEVMAENGLERGDNGLEIYVMCEIPSNVVLAKEFAQRFDGFSIGSNDLTQLTLGVDRDSRLLADIFDESDPAVQWMIRTVIEKAHAVGAKVGFCGQAPSNKPAFADFLVKCGIDSISVTPDSFWQVKQQVARSEARSEQAG